MLFASCIDRSGELHYHIVNSYLPKAEMPLPVDSVLSGQDREDVDDLSLTLSAGLSVLIERIDPDLDLDPYSLI